MEPTAAEIEQLLTRGSFDGPSGVVAFGDALGAAVAGGRLWRADEIAGLVATRTEGPPPAVEVVDATSRSVAARLGDGVGVVVSAHATEAGGGFAREDRGHEEDWCRASGWLRCITSVPAFHALHRAATPLLHDDVVASFPGVPLLRGDAGFLPAAVSATMVASSAPDARTLTLSGRADQDVVPLITRRVDAQLAVLRALGVRTVVLPAFGCGAYGNDPRDVALAYRAALVEGPFGGAFDRVVFAISSEPRSGRPALSAFVRVFPA